LVTLSLAKLAAQRRKAGAAETAATNFEQRKKTLAYLQEYYGTARAPGFDPDHWKTELSPKLLDQIYSDSDCQRALQILGYV
jgi:hypothetical protein